MKNNYLAIIVLVGLIYTSIGALFKILHFEIGPLTGNVILAIGVFLKIVAVVLFIFKLASNKKNDFLNQ